MTESKRLRSNTGSPSVKQSLRSRQRTKSLPPKVDPKGTSKLNPRTRKETPVQQKDISENVYNYTRKTATSLLPKSGKISPYDGQSADAITGLLFDLHKSDLRDEKYTFEGDAGTDDRWWIEGPKDRKKQTPLRKLMESSETKYNEVLAGVKVDGIIGVFFAGGEEKEDLSKLQGIARRQLLIEKMGLTVPLVGLSKTEDPKIVSLSEQMAFLNQFLDKTSDKESGLIKLFNDRVGTLYPWDEEYPAWKDAPELFREQISALYRKQIETLKEDLKSELESSQSSVLQSSSSTASLPESSTV